MGEGSSEGAEYSQCLLAISVKMTSGRRWESGCGPTEGHSAGLVFFRMMVGRTFKLPLRNISKEKFEEMLSHLTSVDLSKVVGGPIPAGGEWLAGRQGCELK